MGWHTPEPWAVGSLADEHGRRHLRITGPGRGENVLADIVNRRDDADPTPDDEANATLMAAAPDLLLCCRNALGAYDALATDGSADFLPGYRHCLERLKAAIAKATGGPT